jgi:CDGSH-type Zn-finger protein
VSNRDTKITIYPDGPLLVRGPIDIESEDGTPITVERPVIALCRCGLSRIRPFCDGTHKQAGFKADSTVEDRGRRSAD